MISKPSASECFVYITLPGEVSAVTAGKFVLTKNARGDPLGRFVYGRSYLDNPQAVEITLAEDIRDRSVEWGLRRVARCRAR